jgi:hypothetical protein
MQKGGREGYLKKKGRKKREGKEEMGSTLFNTLHIISCLLAHLEQFFII